MKELFEKLLSLKEDLTAACVGSSLSDEIFIRELIADEHNAVRKYKDFAAKTVDPETSKVFLDIAKEEEVHVGELQAFLERRLQRDGQTSLDNLYKGAEEVNKLLNESIYDNAINPTEYVASCVEEKMYLEYLEKHIGGVKLVWGNLKELVKPVISEETTNALDLIINDHDKSKYTSEEFNAYRQCFYPIQNEPVDISKFNIAWNHHQKCNKHHWQYWLLIEDSGKEIILEMPFEYIIEMLCDWTSCSIIFNNVPSVWYNENKDNIKFSKRTAILVEGLIPIFDLIFNSVKAKEINESIEPHYNYKDSAELQVIVDKLEKTLEQLDGRYKDIISPFINKLKSFIDARE